MTKNRSFYLDLLANDDRHVGHMVEVLRCAASILRGECYSEETREIVSLKLAEEIRDMAQHLCVHARVSSDGKCRYCELLLAQES
jgi:hypothetical protein